MNDEKIDRRIRKTRALLQQCLLQLMQEKTVQNISVKELSDMADINRGTFYLHYKDVYDLLEKMESSLMDDFQLILNDYFGANNDPEPLDVCVSLYQFLYEHREIFTVLLGPNGDHSFIGQLKDLLKACISGTWDNQHFFSENFTYYFAFLISGCVGLIETWLETGASRSPEDMARLTYEMVKTGIHTFS